METILITGSSGFIGANLAERLLIKGYNIIGFDNENDYYDIGLKKYRRQTLEKYPNFKFYHGDISQLDDIEFIFSEYKIDIVMNLAAYAGIRYSFVNPLSYVESNIIGFSNVLFLSHKYKIKKLIFTSSSSIYGYTDQAVLSVDKVTDKPISLYAATKRSNELMAYSYAHSFGLSTIGLRLFTVYGPKGRPDMAIFKFAQKIKKGETIDIYNYGNMKRDFTYVDDVVDGLMKALDYDTDYDLFNIGSNHPVQLEYVIELLEKNLGIKAKRNYLPMQPGDMIETNADIQHTKEKLGWLPKVSIEEGVKNFVDWFNDYYGKSKK